ncbi:hypothetical protein [Vibrio penaeicida]|nr:hypothetical protein [Vibrio penaeicida]
MAVNKYSIWSLLLNDLVAYKKSGMMPNQHLNRTTWLSSVAFQNRPL